MAEYIAQRIIDGAYSYAFAIGKRPDLKAGIDTYLKQKDQADLIPTMEGSESGE